MLVFGTYFVLSFLYVSRSYMHVAVVCKLSLCVPSTLANIQITTRRDSLLP